MKLYFAPMEGITGYIYRNAFYTCFGEIDKYFTPFIVAAGNRTMSSREVNDILPENNKGLVVVPQILTNNAADFIKIANKIKEFGYEEVNLNLGCPSKTVVAKNKGAGFLDKTRELDNFLEEIFAECNIEISIKTRIGKKFPEEFFDLIEIFNKYPIKELIIHPRTQTDYYKNKPNMEMFRTGLEKSINSVCYNGDIFNIEKYREFQKDFSEVETIMIGRGFITNPNLINEISGKAKFNKERFAKFHESVYQGYKKKLSGERPILFKMKELWGYMIGVFTENEKYAKKIKKVQKLSEYEVVVNNLFRDQELK